MKGYNPPADGFYIGGLEIKFADRTKALSLLYEIGKQSEDAEGLSFFECLEEEDCTEGAD